MPTPGGRGAALMIRALRVFRYFRGWSRMMGDLTMYRVGSAYVGGRVGWLTSPGPRVSPAVVTRQVVSARRGPPRRPHRPACPGVRRCGFDVACNWFSYTYCASPRHHVSTPRERTRHPAPGGRGVASGASAISPHVAAGSDLRPTIAPSRRLLHMHTDPTTEYKIHLWYCVTCQTSLAGSEEEP